MNELQLFSNPEFGDIRTIQRDGATWFVGKDVAEALGYKNTSKALQDNVSDKHKGVTKVTTSRGMQDTTIIDESGLYKLVFGSKLEKAEQFTEWITSEVLPAIRKHGAYMTEDTLNAALLNPDYLLKIVTQLKEETDKRKALEAQAAEDAPYADFCRRVLRTEETMSITNIAKEYGMSGMAMNKLLHEMGIQYKQGGVWMLYADYADKGYTSMRTYITLDSSGGEHSRNATMWTQAGRMFLYEMLKSAGRMPVSVGIGEGGM